MNEIETKGECCSKCDAEVSQLSVGCCSNSQCECHKVSADQKCDICGQFGMGHICTTKAGGEVTETKIGRPTDYNDNTISKTIEYIKACEDEEYDWTKSVSSGKVDSEAWEHRIKVHLPTIEGLAEFLDVSRDTIYEWESKYKDFSDTLKKLRSKQAKMLIEKGLSGDYSPVITKLLLSANHGMKEKTETDITSKGKQIGGFNFVRNDGDNKPNN